MTKILFFSMLIIFSNNLFSQTLNLTAPATSAGSITEFCTDNPIEIKWNSSGLIKVKITIEYNGGLNKDVVIDNYSALIGSYIWQVPRGIYYNKTSIIKVNSLEYPALNSATNNLIIYDSPLIKSQTTDQVICQDEDIDLSVIADGTGLTFQWQKDGIDIIGATSSLLNMKKMQFKNSGDYTCIISGKSACSAKITNKIPVYVAEPLEIIELPPVQYVNIGSTVSLKIEIHANTKPQWGYSPIYFQWVKNGVDIVDDDRFSGSKSDLLTIKNIQASDISARYSIFIFDFCHGILHPIDGLKIMNFEILKTSISTNKVCEGESFWTSIDSLTVPKNSDISYQWCLGSTKLNDDSVHKGTHSDKMKVTNSIKAFSGEYSCILTQNSSGFLLFSDKLPMKVWVAPKLSLDLQDQNVTAGKPLDLNVNAVGDTLYYIWYKDGKVIPNIEQNSFSIVKAKAENAGKYQCAVYNECDTVYSRIANITVAAAEIVYNNVNSLEFSGITASISPNPISENSILKLNSNDNYKINLKLISQTGIVISSLNEININTGNNQIPINEISSNLSSGIYFLMLDIGGESRVMKIEVIR